MARYTVPLTTWANIAVEVETEETDPETIAALACEAVSVSLCHQCTDSRNDGLELGDEWTEVRDPHGSVLMTYHGGSHR